jgi:hypothetical protein
MINPEDLKRIEVVAIEAKEDAVRLVLAENGLQVLIEMRKGPQYPTGHHTVVQVPTPCPEWMKNGPGMEALAEQVLATALANGWPIDDWDTLISNPWGDEPTPDPVN